jgi:lipopolysaccharide export system protein LptA
MKSLINLAGLALALMAAGPAAAQLSQNSSGPIDITSDELSTGQCVSTWSGSAEALQDASRLRADTLKAFFQNKDPKPGATSSNCGDLIRMEAQGSVYYVTPSQRVRSNNAVYEATSDTIIMTGDVVAVQGQNVLRGERLVINTKTGQGQMQTNVKGRNKPGRVRGVFYPKQQQQASAPAAQRP